MKVVWINGWSLDKAFVAKRAEARFPKCQHVVVNPVPGWDRIVESLEAIDILIGYSLGAFSLMGRQDLCQRIGRTILLAPFEDFRAESDRGGKVKRGQLSYLLKCLDRNARAAVADFRIRSGIDEPVNEDTEISVEDLKWGIERLRSDSVDAGTIEAFECYLGSEDALLDSAVLKSMYPNIEIIEGAGHDLKQLLESGRVKL